MLLRRSLISLLLNCFSSFLFSQQVNYSREFASLKSHVPIKIIDADSQSFYVLRYNKTIHDFTVERRNKTNFEIQYFTALKLDSINAAWFDYENLDYLLFEHNYRIYFVFEKALNHKKSIFIKSIDSSGKASDFKELASLEKEETNKDIRFVFKRSGEMQLLVVGEQYYNNATAKKMILLYNLDKNLNDYVVKLPLENQVSGFSQEYNYANKCLYYLMGNHYLAGYRKKYTVNQELQEPFYESTFLSLNVFNMDVKEIHQTDLCLKGKVEVKSSKIVTSNKQVNLLLNYAVRDENNKAAWRFSNLAFTLDVSKKIYCYERAVDSIIHQQLSFYEDSEVAEATEKQYKPYKILVGDEFIFQLNDRSETNTYNEILLWKSNLLNGQVEHQKIIPRKLFYLRNQTRYHYLQELSIMQKDGNFYALMIENRGNVKLNPEKFNTAEIKKQRHVWAANLMLYHMTVAGELTKRIIHKNGSINAIPINFEGHQNEFIFYLNKGKREKFAILSL